MSKTYKDKKLNSQNPKLKRNSEGKIRSRHFEKYKRFGPPEPIDQHCKHCGIIPDFENGFLVCPNCDYDDFEYHNLINFYAGNFAA